MSKTKIILFTGVALLIPFYNSLAQQLEKIPGQDPVGESDLIGYLDSLYKFGISITGILAIFMIALGAFAYIVTSAGNASKMLDAKEKITNALIGLVIALTAYLFLYVINPDLVGGTLESPGEIMSQMVSGEEEKEGEPVYPEDGARCGVADPDLSNPGYIINSAYSDCAGCENGYYITNETATIPSAKDAFCGPNPEEVDSKNDTDGSEGATGDGDDHGLGDMMPEEEDMQ